MTIEIVLHLEPEEAEELAYDLVVLSFEEQKMAAYWEGMGDYRLNQVKHKHAQLLSKLANIMAMAHWTEEQRIKYNLEEAKENE